MKKVLLLAGLLLVLVAPTAMADGINLAWGADCFGFATTTQVVTFACASNTTPANWKLTPSFILDAETMVGAIDTFVEGVFEAGAVPNYWKRSVSGDCNYGTGTNYLVGGAYAGASGSCFDPFESVGSGGGGYGYLTPTQVQIEGIFGSATYATVAAGAETFCCTITLKNAKTTGAGACAGCSQGVVWGIHHIILTTPTGDITVPTATDFVGQQCTVFQHGFGDQPCVAPVPARNTTWGQVKSLYR